MIRYVRAGRTLYSSLKILVNCEGSQFSCSLYVCEIPLGPTGISKLVY